MPTLADAQAKWERKTAVAGPRWQAAKSRAKEMFRNSPRYATLGVRPGPLTIANYERELDAASQASFEDGVRGKGPYWAEKFREGFGS